MVADMSRNLLHFATSLLLGASLGACSTASSDLQTGTALAPPIQTASTTQTASTAQTASPAPAYQLNEKELKMSCKRLVGTMKIRILQMRTEPADGTLVARTMQSGAVKIFGGPTFGTDPASEASQNMAMLAAYNQQLATKKCKTLDLQAELHPEIPAAQPQKTNL